MNTKTKLKKEIELAIINGSILIGCGRRREVINHINKIIDRYVL